MNINDVKDRDAPWVWPFYRLFSTSYGLGFFISVLAVLWTFAGCVEKKESLSSGDYLLCIGEKIATEDDFNRILMITVSVYSRRELRDPGFMKEIRRRVLDQMIEEMILVKVAETKQIDLSEIELDEAISNLKNDYPEGAFEQVFLENAVAFDSWKSRLKIRLLAEKVARKLFEHQTMVFPDEISEYVRRHKSQLEIESTDPRRNHRIDEIVMQILRKEKIEKAYTRWMKKLRKETPVQINRELWLKINGSIEWFQPVDGNTPKAVVRQVSLSN